MDSNKDWYYLDGDNQVTGPLTRDALSQLVAAGVISDQTLVAVAGTENWAPFLHVDSLDLQNDTPVERDGSPVINLKCSRCGQRLSVTPDKQGMNVRCPNCNERVVVPSNAELAEQHGGRTHSSTGSSLHGARQGRRHWKLWAVLVPLTLLVALIWTFRSYLARTGHQDDYIKNLLDASETLDAGLACWAEIDHLCSDSKSADLDILQSRGQELHLCFEKLADQLNHLNMNGPDGHETTVWTAATKEVSDYAQEPGSVDLQHFEVVLTELRQSMRKEIRSFNIGLGERLMFKYR